MRIALVSTTMTRGGAEVQVKDLASRFVQRGHTVAVISLLPFQYFEDELLAHGVKTISIDMERGAALAIGSLRALTRVLRAFAPDVVHAHMFGAIIASRAARAAMMPFSRRRSTRPVVVGTSHTPFEAVDRRYLIYRLSEPFSDLWTCVCQEGIDTHERARAVRHGTGVLSSNGVDVKRFGLSAERRHAKRRELGIHDEFVWLSAGSFRDEQKDFGNLLRAFAESRRDTAVRLLIAGGGPLLEEKRALAAQLGVDDHVTFLGMRSDMHDLLGAADGFVLGSSFEALPIALLEASASSLPIVATRVGQNHDIVIDGTGFLVPPRDSARLAEAMSALVARPAPERNTMGARAREHVAKTYDLDVVAQWWEDTYTSLLRKRARC